MQQVVAVGTTPIHTTIVGFTPLLLPHRIATACVGINRCIEDCVTVSMSRRPALLKFGPTTVILRGRNVHAVLRSGASSGGLGLVLLVLIVLALF